MLGLPFSYFILGTFLQFGEPEKHDKIHRGVRSILFLNGFLWIAHEDLEGVVVASVLTGKIVKVVTLNSPIGNPSTTTIARMTLQYPHV
jgi:hypothetical protein